MTESIECRSMERTDGDLELFKSCFDDNGSDRDLEHLRWQYLESPGGQLFVDFAMGTDPETANRVLAGIYAAFPVPMTIGGRDAVGVQSLDTMTDARFRRRGLFRLLASGLYERLERSDVSLVYGFPNGHSAHGFFKRLEWENLDPVPFMVRPLRTGYALRRLGRAGKLGAAVLDVPIPVRRHRRALRNAVLAVETEFGEDYDELWRVVSRPMGVAVRRDAAYLRWRLSRNPRFRYTTLAVRRDGVLQGFASYRVACKHGGTIGYLMEVLCRPGASGVGRALVGHALRGMRDEGAEVALGWSLEHAQNHSLYTRAGFLPLPEKYRPIELHFGARVFGASPASPSLQRSEWYLSYLDSDSV